MGNVLHLWYLIPLGALGLFRWCCWLVRRIPASQYQPFRSDHRELITVVTPVYEEDPRIFRYAVSSWLENDWVVEVICVIDATDEACLAVANELALTHPVQVIVTDVPGKRPALKLGWEHAQTSLVALVDSDTIWARDVSDRVCEPFADPAIFGVGTRQNVYNPASFLERVNDIYLDYRYFDENAAQTVVGQAVSCLSGRTAVYRRGFLLTVGDEFISESFAGKPCNSGDDKRLTTLLLAHGHRTYMQRTARVWSTFPSKPREFFLQRLRWSRNTWRSDLRALWQGWVYRYPFLTFTMLDKAVSSFTLLISPAFFVLALIDGRYSFAAILVSWWLVSRAAKLAPHFRRRPVDLVILPAFILLTFVMATVKIYALLTLTTQRWLTRRVAVVDGEVTRV
ncbi:MAG TPA: glycosyltransferase [Acidimicrobiia bacterium]|nr:glycosyltransferase [Acidimicrobiia bacterium]